jgi:hypothetical protein
MSDTAVKHDAGKLPWDLYPFDAAEMTLAVLQFGAQKYAAHNWRKGMEWSRMFSALMRHLLAWQRGEDIDPESGLPHLGHAGCCLAFLQAYTLHNIGKDDRYRP